MTSQQIITGHEAEIAALSEAEKSPEFRALCIKMAGEGLAEAGETLRLAALGQLGPVSENIFGEAETVEQQVSAAELAIERHIASLAKFF